MNSWWLVAFSSNFLMNGGSRVHLKLMIGQDFRIPTFRLVIWRRNTLDCFKLVNRLLDILDNMGMIDLGDFKVDGSNLAIEHISPLAQAQDEEDVLKIKIASEKAEFPPCSAAKS